MVYSTLDALHAQFGDDLELVCGMARGADSHAARWAHDHGVTLHEFPADWRRYGKSAGPRRNARMLEQGQPELVLAFADDLEASRGTADMVTKAEAAKVPVVLIRHPEGAEV